MNDINTQNVCKHCQFEIEFITERWIKVVTDGVYCVKNPSTSQVGVYGFHEPVSEPASTDAPKVEEIARQICSELYLCFGKRHLVVSPLLEKSSREQVSAILRPYFSKEKE